MTMSSSSGLDTHPLQHSWELYLHYPSYSSGEAYSTEAYKALCEFSSVEAFWRYYSFIPTPSDVFTEVGPAATSLIKRKLDGKALEAFGLFKMDVRPEWEDATNKRGGHWECRRPFDLPQLDKLWNNIVLGLIGETLEGGKHGVVGPVITGARVVDKSKNNRPEYRLELWTCTKDHSINNEIKLRLLQCVLEEGGVEVEFVWKDHASALEALPQATPLTNDTPTTTAPKVGGANKDMLREAMGLASSASATVSVTDKPPSS